MKQISCFITLLLFGVLFTSCEKPAEWKRINDFFRNETLTMSGARIRLSEKSISNIIRTQSSDSIGDIKSYFQKLESNLVKVTYSDWGTFLSFKEGFGETQLTLQLDHAGSKDWFISYIMDPK